MTQSAWSTESLGGPPPRRESFDAAGEAADALSAEARLLTRLGDVLRRQRDAVASDQLEELERSVYDAQRILATLAEARRGRRTLMSLLTGASDARLADLESVATRRGHEGLGDAVDALRRATRSLASDLAVNRRVLDSAVRGGDELIRALCGGAAPETDVAYGGGGGPRGGLLVDRQI